MPLSPQEHLQSCFAAFLVRDYQRCAVIAFSQQFVMPMTLHFGFVSSQRIGTPAELMNGEADRVLDRLASMEWVCAQLRLTVGRESFEKTIAKASTDEERLEAHLCNALRLQTSGDLDGARQEFELIAAGPECMEREIGRMIAAAPPPPPPGAHLRAQELAGEGDAEKSAEEMREAVRYAEATLGSDYPLTIEILNAAAVAALGRSEFGEAGQFARRALTAARGIWNMHPQVAVALAVIARQLHAEGDIGEAIEAQRESVEVYRDIGDRRSYVGSLVRLANFLTLASRFEEAIDAYTGAAMVAARGGSDDDPGKIMIAAAGVFLDAGRDQAVAFLESVANAVNDVEQAEPRAEILRNLVTCAMLCDETALAEKALGELEALVGIGDDRFIERLAAFTYYLSTIEEGTRAQEISRRILDASRGGSNASATIDYEMNLARVLGMADKHAEAALVLTPVLKRLRVDFPDDVGRLAWVLDSLSICHRHTGDLAASILLLEELARIEAKRSGEHSLKYGEVLSTLVVLYQRLGNQSQAEAFMGIAENIADDAGDEGRALKARMLVARAGRIVAAMNFAGGRKVVQEAVDLYRVIDPDSREALVAEFNLAGLYAEEDPAAADRIVTDLLARTDIRGMLVVGVLNTMAVVSFKRGDLDAARTYAERAVAAIDDECRDAGMFAFAPYEVLMMLHTLDGNPEGATAQLVELLQLLNQYVPQVVRSTSTEERRHVYRQLQPHVDAWLTVFARDGFGSGRANELMFDAVLRLKGLEAASVDALRNEIVRDDPSLSTALKEFFALRRELADRDVTGPPPGTDSTQFMMEMRTQRGKLRGLERDLWLKIDPAAVSVAMTSATADAIRDALDVRTVFCEFIQHRVIPLEAIGNSIDQSKLPLAYSVFIFIGAEVHFFDVGLDESIDRAIADYRDELTLRFAEGVIPAEDLTRALFGPIAETLGSYERMIVAPDGELWRLPFEALPLKDGHFIDFLEIIYVSTGREVLRVTRPLLEVPFSAPLIIAAPEYGDVVPIGPSLEIAKRAEVESTAYEGGKVVVGEGLYFAPLPGTREEGERVGRRLGVTPVMGAGAIKEVLLGVHSPAVVHLATHGFFLESRFGEAVEALEMDILITAEHAIGGRGSARLPNPLLRCGLAMAGANYWMAWLEPPPGAGNGLLTAEEVGLLDLHGTELVVLSACDTGLGELRRGQGVLGLRRAFEVAGVRTLIVSLWNLPDAETVELVDLLYDRLLRGESCASALRHAQLTMKSRHQKPYYWAGFVCQGDPRALRFATDATSVAPTHRVTPILQSDSAS